MNSRKIYHITHVDNLASILEEGRLWSDSRRIALNLASTNIGHAHIKQRRLHRIVDQGTGRKLGDYVPFNFCPRSVMLYVIHRGSVEGYDGGQEPILHLVSSVGTAIDTGQSWVFTNRHAELAYAEYFDCVSRESEVDWSVMPLKYWAESEEIKERRQAEFLVHDGFPFDGIEEIGVHSSEVREKVESILRHSAFTPRVSVRRSWYY